MFGRPGKDEIRTIAGNASANTDILHMANMYWYRQPVISIRNARVHLAGNTPNKKSQAPFANVGNVMDDRTDTLINSALDAFGEIGRYDLELNYCIDATQ